MTEAVKRSAVVVLAVTLTLAFAAVARADGDPAGDVLAAQTVFYGSALNLKSDEAAQLPALLEQAKAAGYELRVAAMSVQADMGAIDYMWDDPLNYVDFLAQELAYRYTGRVLVVMPSGYAIYRLGHSRVRDQRVLDKLTPVGADPIAVLPGALDAVVALAKAAGIRLPVPDVAAPPGGMTQPVSDFEKRQNAAARVGSGARSTRAQTSGSDNALLYVLPVLLLVIAAGVAITRNRLRERAT